MTIVAAADGSALGNPGPAGWAWYVDDECWAAGGWEKSTNNRGELTAVLELLTTTADEGLSDETLHIQCDSQYVINSLTKWRFGWKKRGWKKADGKTVENVDLMKALDDAMAGRNVEFEWVRGHVGHPMNEAADERARAAATAYQQGTPVPSGPGWNSQKNAANPHSTSAASADEAGEKFSSDDDEASASSREIRLVRMDSQGRDRDELCAFLTSSDFPYHLTVHPTAEIAYQWIDDGRFDGPSAASFWVEERRAGHVGVVTFEQLDHDWPLLALRLASSARGQGIGKTACRMATQLLFDTHRSIHRCEAQTRADNTPMRATLESLGWKLEGVCQRAWPTLGEDGTMRWSHDKAIYAILRD